MFARLCADLADQAAAPAGAPERELGNGVCGSKEHTATSVWVLLPPPSSASQPVVSQAAQLGHEGTLFLLTEGRGEAGG